jgi:deoxycytidylate deaminase
MKTDAYLSLCLEQAAKSSLHYKHGSIIVNGGKVIGHGYNDYKPGFNGGALKNGRIAKGALDGPAIANLKQKLKKQKGKPKQNQSQRPQTTFTPFEATGGGHNANTPLSIHSEMMAVHSALAASSTLSSNAFSCEKPCFKLPRSDKRKARLRREVLASYVKAVCETAQRSGQLQVQECGFEAAAYQPDCPPPRLQRQGGAGGCGRGAGGEGGAGVARVERGGKGVSCGVEWRETSSEEGEEKEEERGVSVSVSVPGSVRPVWTTDRATTAICV